MLAKIQGELKSIEDFLQTAVIPQKQSEAELPTLDESLQQQVGILNEKLRTHQEDCKKIDINNMYISMKEIIYLLKWIYKLQKHLKTVINYKR